MHALHGSVMNMVVVMHARVVNVVHARERSEIVYACVFSLQRERTYTRHAKRERQAR